MLVSDAIFFKTSIRLDFVGLFNNKIHENWCSTISNETILFVFFGNGNSICADVVQVHLYKHIFEDTINPSLCLLQTTSQ